MASVMAGLSPATLSLLMAARKMWVAGTRPAMADGLHRLPKRPVLFLSRRCNGDPHHHISTDEACRCEEINPPTARGTSNENPCLVQAWRLGRRGWCSRDGYCRLHATRMDDVGECRVARPRACQHGSRCGTCAVLRSEGAARPRQRHIRKIAVGDVILFAQRHGDEGRMGDRGE